MTNCSWSTTSDDVKTMIFELLDYRSRCNMRLCSKHDKELIDSIQFTTGNLKIEEISSSEKSKMCISLDDFTIWTSKENSEQQNELNEPMEQFLTKLFQKVSHFNSLHLSNLQLPCQWHFSTQSLTIHGSTHTISISWLQHQCATNYKSLYIGRQNWTTSPLPDNILNVSEHLHFQIPTTITDEQLDRIEAVDVTLASLHLTSEGVKRFVARHLKFGRRDDKLELRFSNSDGDYFDVLPGGLELKKTELPPDEDYYFEVLITGGFENIHGFQSPRLLTMFENNDYTVLNCKIDTDCE